MTEYSQSIANSCHLTNEYRREDVETYVKKSGSKIISRKGCTVYGIATSAMHIVKTIGGSAASVMTLSSLHEGEYGLNDVCLSSLALVGAGGIRSIVTPKLSDEEMQKLYLSAEALKAVIKSVDF